MCVKTTPGQTEISNDLREAPAHQSGKGQRSFPNCQESIKIKRSFLGVEVSANSPWRSDHATLREVGSMDPSQQVRGQRSGLVWKGCRKKPVLSKTSSWRNHKTSGTKPDTYPECTAANRKWAGIVSVSTEVGGWWFGLFAAIYWTVKKIQKKQPIYMTEKLK